MNFTINKFVKKSRKIIFLSLILRANLIQLLKEKIAQLLIESKLFFNILNINLNIININLNIKKVFFVFYIL